MLLVLIVLQGGNGVKRTVDLKLNLLLFSFYHSPSSEQTFKKMHPERRCRRSGLPDRRTAVVLAELIKCKTNLGGQPADRF